MNFRYFYPVLGKGHLREVPCAKNTIIFRIRKQGHGTYRTIHVELDFSFPKKEKLKSKKLIEQLFKERNSVSSFPLRLYYLKTASTEGPKIVTAVSVPKKNFGSAVKRNKIKRQLREAYRLNKHPVFNNSEGNFAFLILYLGKEMPASDDVGKSMKQLLQKFQKKINDAKID